MNIPPAISALYARVRHTQQDPVRDWLILIGISAVALIGIISWHAVSFRAVENGEPSGVSAVEAPAVFNRASLDAITSLFASRALEAQKYREGTYQYSDPSL